MRIALTIEYFDPSKGGGERYAINFGRALLDAGHEVHVFTNEWDPSETAFTYHRVPGTPMKILRRFAFARRAAALVQQQEPPFDLVLGFGKSVYMDVFRPGGGVHRAWMEQELKTVEPGLKRLIVRLRQFLSLDQRLVLRLEKEQFGPDGPHVIANSNMLKEDILRFYGTPAERIHVIHNGVDLERYNPRNHERYRDEVRRELGLREEVMLLFMGHNFRRKGLEAAIRALPKLRGASPAVRLVVAGRGRAGHYRKLARRLGCEDLAQYVGARERPERLYAAADILVFPSYYDPFANVVLEAMASGLPVVTSIYNGSSELIEVGLTGYVVDPDDTEALVRAIRGLLGPEERAAAGRAARKRAEEFPVLRNVREVLMLCTTVLAETHGRALAGAEARECLGTE